MMVSAEQAHRCRICGGKQLSPRFSVRGYDLEQCAACSFVQVRAKPNQADLDAIYQDAYFAHNKYRDENSLRAENRRRLRLLEKFVAHGSRVLEVGCGDGSFIKEAKAVFEMHGFDLSPAGIQKAQAQNPELAARLWAGRIEDQAIPEEAFDAICMWDVIEHIWDPYHVSQQLLKYLKPSGTLFISTPNIGAKTAQIMGKRWAFMTPPEHLGFFNLRSIKELFEKQLSTEVMMWRSMGKQANFGFVLYKARRVFPIIPQFIPKLFEHPLLSKLSFYIPTGDIQYLAIRKR